MLSCSGKDQSKIEGYITKDTSNIVLTRAVIATERHLKEAYSSYSALEPVFRAGSLDRDVVELRHEME